MTQYKLVMRELIAYHSATKQMKYIDGYINVVKELKILFFLGALLHRGEFYKSSKDIHKPTIGYVFTKDSYKFKCIYYYDLSTKKILEKIRERKEREEKTKSYTHAYGQYTIGYKICKCLFLIK